MSPREPAGPAHPLLNPQGMGLRLWDTYDAAESEGGREGGGAVEVSQTDVNCGRASSLVGAMGGILGASEQREQISPHFGEWSQVPGREREVGLGPWVCRSQTYPGPPKGVDLEPRYPSI